MILVGCDTTSAFAPSKVEGHAVNNAGDTIVMEGAELRFSSYFFKLFYEHGMKQLNMTSRAGTHLEAKFAPANEFSVGAFGGFFIETDQQRHMNSKRSTASGSHLGAVASLEL